MCDYSAIVIKKDGSREKIMESVETIIKDENFYLAKNIFGEEVKISGSFELFDSSNNEIVFKEG